MELTEGNLVPFSVVSRNFQPGLPADLMDHCESGALQKI